MGILDEGRNATGAGTQAPTHASGNGGTVDLSMARTQIQATEIIADTLMRQGLRKGTKAYQDAFDAAWKDNNAQSFPME